MTVIRRVIMDNTSVTQRMKNEMAMRWVSDLEYSADGSKVVFDIPSDNPLSSTFFDHVLYTAEEVRNIKAASPNVWLESEE